MGSCASSAMRPAVTPSFRFCSNDPDTKIRGAVAIFGSPMNREAAANKLGITLA